MITPPLCGPMPALDGSTRAAANPAAAPASLTSEAPPLSRAVPALAGWLRSGARCDGMLLGEALTAVGRNQVRTSAQVGIGFSRSERRAEPEVSTAGKRGHSGIRNAPTRFNPLGSRSCCPGIVASKNRASREEIRNADHSPPSRCSSIPAAPNSVIPTARVARTLSKYTAAVSASPRTRWYCPM